MNTISFSRLKHLIRYDVVSSWRYMGVILLISTLLLTLVQLGVLFVYIPDGLGIINGPSASEVSYAMGGIYMIWASGLLLFISQLLAANFQYGAMTKQTRMQMLLLPATMTEKFIVYFLRITVGLGVVFVAALLFSELLRMALAPLMSLPTYGFILLEGLTVAFDKGLLLLENAPALSLLFVAMIVQGNGFYVLCGCFFRKHPIVMSLVTNQILSMVLSFLFFLLSMFIVNEPDVMDTLYDVYLTGRTDIFLYLFIVLTFGLAAVEYLLAYWLFTRQQLLGRAWINV